MTEHNPADELRQPCVRGCTQRDRHDTDCANEGCRGCLPRMHWRLSSQLCYPCHRRLTETLNAVTVQHDMLQATAGMAAPRQMRGDADIIQGKGGQAKTPIRLACIDAARDLADLLSTLVERLVDDHKMRGPKRLMSNADRIDPRRRVAITHGERDGYRWTDPPARFEVNTAANWLRAQQERLEALDTIGDEFEELSQAMSQAHALAPWREPMQRMNGIECPKCHAYALVLFGGCEDVTCQRCGESIPPAKYAFWVRLLTHEAEAG